MTLSTSSADDVALRRLGLLVFLLSAAVLGYEIALMRLLLLASWHHFAFLVISIALLGFGASGTVLSFAQPLVRGRPATVLLSATLVTAAAMPLCWQVVQHLPVESRIVPALAWEQLGWWLLFWLLLGLPFLAGAGAIGAALMIARGDIARIYGSNLLGSAAGALLAPLCMFFVPPEWLVFALAAPALAAAACVRPERRAVTIALWTAALALLVAGPALERPRVRVDPLKYGGYLERLVAQGAARHAGRRISPRAVVDVYESDVLHDLPFLGVGGGAPRVSPIVVDGHLAGSVLDADEREQAAVVDRTLMAFAYVLAPPQPRVALLGEVGGANAWLAARHDADRIDIVHPYAHVPDLLRGPLRDAGGAVLDLETAHVTIAEPRHFIGHAAGTFDLIQLVTLESSAAGSGGVAGLGQEHLVTIEGITACLERLGGRGVLAVCRGIQTPPRDNVKLLATIVEALRRRGVDDPARHVVIVRDYLAVSIVARRTPFATADAERVRLACAERELTPVWFEGIRDDELNQPDALPSPPGGGGDWYHHAARQLFSNDAGGFIEEYVYDVRPPSDDRPFFFDFCRLDAIAALRAAYGDLWLTRIELAYLFVLAACGAIAVSGALLTVAPLLFVRAIRRHARRGATAWYFTAIGLAYLAFEIVCLSRLTLLIGDPVLAAAIVIAGFLLFSGLGALTAQRMGHPGPRTAALVIATLVVVAAVVLAALMPLAAWGGALSLPVRCTAALTLLAPVSYLMGFPMPMALARLSARAPALVPWAWGVNGFASVLSAPVATAAGMAWGFTAAGLGAIALYALAAVLFARLPGGGD